MGCLSLLVCGWLLCYGKEVVVISPAALLEAAFPEASNLSLAV